MTEAAGEADLMKWRFGNEAGVARLGATFTPTGAFERHAGEMMPAYVGKFSGMRGSKPTPRPKRKAD